MVTLRKSANVDVGTPPDFFRGVSALFGPFDLDVCCNPPATMPLASRYFTPAEDGLVQPWSGRAWCNPPYGEEAAWIVKGATEPALSAHLVPVKSSMLWWRVVVKRAAFLLFIEGRLHFVGYPWSAGFASALIVFDPERKGPPILGQLSRKGELL